MKKKAIILAGGEGSRAGGDVPKQFQKLIGKPMYLYSMEAFRDEDPQTEILLVCHPGMFDLLDLQMAELAAPLPYTLICGGRSRRESVHHALMEIPADEECLVAVHDSARPLADVALIRRGWATALEHSSAVPVVPVTDSLRRLESSGCSKAIDRSEFVAVQTPQIFTSSLLHKAYAQPDSPLFTDDASMVEALGQSVALYQGAPENIKITHPADFAIAEALLKRNGLATIE